ncbi:MAG: hypothetical protein JJD96_04500, partial [Thermoleophilia bacterium]|nr:hypothetical protein [Thermoleophilia bacterium]
VEALVVLVAVVAVEVFTEAVAVAVVSDDPLSEPQPLNMATSVKSAAKPISFFFPDCIYCLHSSLSWLRLNITLNVLSFR